MNTPNDETKGGNVVSRRQFLTAGAVVGAGMFVPWRLLTTPTVQHGHASAVLQMIAGQQTRLPGKNIPQFVDRLPLLSVAGGPSPWIETLLDSSVELTMSEFRAKVMPSTFKPGTYKGTYVWGYRSDPVDSDSAAETYIGPVIVARRGTPTTIKWVNELGNADPQRPGEGSNTSLVAWLNATDQTLHWADPLGTGHTMDNYSGPIPAVPHLHGGEIPPQLDGGPDAWFTSDGAYHGHAFYTKDGTKSNYAIYRYPNTQEAAPTWFHDHVLGITRLNVFAGLAGAFPIIDLNLQLPTGLHPVGLQQGSDASSVDYLIPLVIQDRAFDVDGQLFFDNLGINPEHPYWIPELVADTIVVNGKVWPYLDVQPKRYRFLFINGSNARTYEMFLTNPVTKVMGPAMYQIATDGGYLDKPVKIDPNAPKGQMQRLTLMPGERADVIIDFTSAAGQTLILRNIAKTPFPAGITPNGSTTGRIIQFRVGAPLVGFTDNSYNPASGIALRPPMIRLVNPTTGALAVAAQKKRQLTLNEIMGAGGPLEILVNNTKWTGESSRTYNDFTQIGHELFSELPNEGDTEVWEIINLTADAHPIHTHLTQFQVMNRQNFDVAKYNAAYAAAFPGGTAVDPMTGLETNYAPGVYIPAFGPPKDYNVNQTPTAPVPTYGGNPDVTRFLKGMPMPPAANETGWKDTVIMYPVQVTRIVVRYMPTDKPAGTTGTAAAYPFDPNGGHGYVWHCHIIDHEDNEMMRPLAVKPKAGAERTVTDY